MWYRICSSSSSSTSIRLALPRLAPLTPSVLSVLVLLPGIDQGHHITNHISNIGIMVALHRDAPLSDCCARTLIHHLAFDPDLQDCVWRSTRSGNTSNIAVRCSGYPTGGPCDLPKLLELLDGLGVDHVAQTILWHRSKEPPGSSLQLGALITYQVLPQFTLVLKRPALASATATNVRLWPFATINF